MSLFHNSALIGASGQSTGATGFQVSRSLRFNSSDSGFLSRTPAVAGNRKTWTWAGWVKRSKLNNGSGQQVILAANLDGTDTGELIVFFHTTDQIYIVNTTTNLRITNQVFRDVSAWYHIVIAVDTTVATANDRIKLYVNGTEATFGTISNPSQNSDTGINSVTAHNIGRYTGGSTYLDGYLADIHFIDGQALTPSSFTEVSATTGQLIPLAYSGSFGTNGFWLKFSDNSAATAAALGNDYSGNNNDWTPNNLSVTAGAGNDSLVDTPTSISATDTGVGGEIRGNYCTFNPLFALASLTLTNGNLETSSPGAAWKNAKGTLAMTTGKWYWEHTVPTTGASDGYIGGVATAAADYSSSGAGIWGRQGTTKYSNGSNSTPFGSTTSGDILGFAFDADTGKLWVAQNGTWVGDPAAGTSESWSSIPSGVFPYVAAYNQANVINFGQRVFAYTNGRSGFKALCDTNLGAPVVAKPNTVMDVVLYTGTGAALTPTSSLGFNPDWIWIKSRSAATDHALYDVVRGAQARLESNNSDAEVTSDDGVTAFNSAGFTLGTLAQVNTSSATYAAWCWDAGTSTVSNTAGSITSQVRANVSAGFSVVTYTGNLSGNGNVTVGHGLGVAPQLIITKARSGSSRWAVQMPTALAANNYLELNTTAAQSSWGGQTRANPTSTTFDTIYAGGVNESGVTYVAYCFAPVVGYSSMGSYVGNGSSDGVFVYTGFRPAFVMMKMSSSTSHWWINDNKRTGSYNVADGLLFPNLSSSESTFATMDLLSNGFKLRAASSDINTSSATYIYAAFAESPFQYARAR